MAQGITLTSSGASAAIDLNASAKTTTLQYVVTAGSSGSCFIQFTLDDVVPGSGQTATWGSLSSQINSSGVDGTGATYTVLSPVSGVRLFGVATSSSGGVTQTTATLRVIQSITG